MISRVKRYFLEIKDFSNPIELNIPQDYQIILDDKKDFELNKFFYKQIGKNYRWKDGIPQYTMDQEELISAVRGFELKNNNFFITGNYFNGVSVSDCIQKSYEIVKKSF